MRNIVQSSLIFLQLNGYLKTENSCDDLEIPDRKSCAKFKTPELTVQEFLLFQT